MMASPSAPSKSSSIALSGIQNGTYCGPADWTDVAKFFLANYLTHAFTVITTPGANFRESLAFTLWALAMPFAGIGRAFSVIARFARGEQSDLLMARRAYALYTVVKFTFVGAEGGAGGDWRCEPEGIVHPYRVGFISV